MDPNSSPEPSNESLFRLLKRHRVMVGLFLAAAVVGAAVGASQLPDDIALARRVIGGAISGAGIIFLMTATKMMN
jgi:hypothetical protein